MKEIQEGMTNAEVIEIMIDQRVNERFERMKLELREEIAHFYQKNAACSSGSDQFYRQQSYISTLVQVQGIEHNVHAELTEAIEKLKELTYA